ncbi:MAG: diguanylate cyclase [Fibrobacterota bacterium]
MKDKRLHFAVIVSSLEESCQKEMWLGIRAFAEKNNITLSVLTGTVQQRTGVFECHYDIIFDALAASSVYDGYIVFTGSIADGASPEKAREYCGRLAGKPTISLAMNVPGVSSVQVENSRGIVDAVTHLVQEHSKENIAFIKGNEGHPEADERFAAYCRTLKELDIPVREELIVPGNFSVQSGHAGIQNLLQRGAGFDAVCCVDDATALGALKELYFQGFSVPEDIAVTGFDNIEKSSILTPTLTTVTQPFFDIGYLGCEQLVIQCRRKPEVKRFQIPSRLKIRQSCGCFARKIPLRENEQQGLRDLAHPERLFEETDIDIYIAKEWIDTLNQLFTPESTPDFIREFTTFLIDYDQISDNYTPWKQFIALLSQSVEYGATGPSDMSALYKALLECSYTLNTMEVHRKNREILDDSNQQWLIRGAIHRILTSFGKDDFFQKLDTSFRELVMGRTLIAVYDTPVYYNGGWEKPDFIHVIWKYDGHAGSSADPAQSDYRFSSFLDAAETVFDIPMEDPVVMPVYYGSMQLGLMITEYSRTLPVNTYETLRLSISTALHEVNMVEEVRDLSVKDELTSLYNRRGFINLAESHLQHIRRSNSRASLLFIDMDHLKRINDIHGHKAGDTAITALARILKHSVRTEDVVSRYGGDEFLVLLQGEGSAPQVEERIRRETDKFNTDHNKDYDLSCSIGSIEITIDNSHEDLSDLIRRADQALYTEKERKKSAL